MGFKTHAPTDAELGCDGPEYWFGPDEDGLTEEEARYWEALLEYGDELGSPCTCTMDQTCNNCLTEVPY